MERVELHCHSKYSKMDGIAYPYDIVDFAKKNGMKAVAVTDHGSIKAFPELEWATSGTDCDVKPIYGIEAYIVNDYERAVYNYKGQDCSKVIVVDIETTGLSVENDVIIEIGALKIENGIVVDRFSSFVNPKREIPELIVNLTGITNEMVADAPFIDVVLDEFIDFADDCILVAHNANFDIGFLKKAAIMNGLSFEPTYVDTLLLSRFVYPNVKRRSLIRFCKEVGVDVKVENLHRAVDDAEACSNLYLHLLQKLETRCVPLAEVDEYMNVSHFLNGRTFHVTVLIKNLEGKKTLYKLISLAEQNKRERNIISLKTLVENREHLLLGSGCDAGLLFNSIIDGKDDDVVEDIAKKFDFIEIQPHMLHKYLIDSNQHPDITSEEDLVKINKRIIELGEKLGIPVVATGDVHYIYKEDILSKQVLDRYNLFDFNDDTDLHFRTTREMLGEFSYLSKEKAEEVVITNSNMIADMCREFSVFPNERCYPVIANQEEILRQICINEAEEKFGSPIPEDIRERIEWELEAVRNTEMEFAFIRLYNLLYELEVASFEINTRGCAGNLLLSYLLGISDFCPTEYNLSPLFAVGSKKEKEIDIDVNLSIKRQKEAYKLYGRKESAMTLLAGDDLYISEEGATYAVSEYEHKMGISFDEKTRAKVIRDLNDVYKGKTSHPGGVVVIPEGKELHDFTPLALTEDGTETTYFNYYRLDQCLFKQDLLHYVGLDMLEELEQETGSDLCVLTYDEPEIMSLFNVIEDEGLAGCMVLPEFRHQGSREILKKAQPKSFNELVKVIGLCHGTDVWLDNAEKLLSDGGVELSEIIATRDDIFDYLVEHGIEEMTAFTITEQIRKGIWARGKAKRYEEFVGMMRDVGIPEWYISSCNKIRYLFPRAHAISYARLNWRLGWYKLHYPNTYDMIANKYL